jgi:hypothetical protein
LSTAYSLGFSTEKVDKTPVVLPDVGFVSIGAKKINLAGSKFNYVARCTPSGGCVGKDIVLCGL